MAIRERVIEVIEEVRPSLQLDGIEIEFDSLEGATVRLNVRAAEPGSPAAEGRLGWKPGGCGQWTLSLRQQIERQIKSRVPEVQSLVTREPTDAR